MGDRAPVMTLYRDVNMLPGTDRRVAMLEVELERVRHEFEHALRSVPADRLSLAPVGQWSPAQIVWHVAKVERGVARMIERLDAAIGPMDTVPPGPGIANVLQLLDQYPFKDRTRKLRAPEPISPPESVDMVVERGRWADGRVQLLAAIHAAGPRLSLIKFDHPFFGTFDGWQWTLMIARHEERHLLQLHEVVAATG